MLHMLVEQARMADDRDDLSDTEQGMPEEQTRISSYEEAFIRIKEATGVADPPEVVNRFENQGETQRHLEQLRRESETKIVKLREEMESLQVEYEQRKFTGEEKIARGVRIVEEYEEKVREEEAKREETEQQLDKTSKLLLKVKSGIENLAEKLRILHAPSGRLPSGSPASHQYALDQVEISEEKLLTLLSEFEGHELAELQGRMEEEEYQRKAEMMIPRHNTRIKLPLEDADAIFGDESEEDEVVTRQTIKRQSQQIIDAKTRRRAPARRRRKPLK